MKRSDLGVRWRMALGLVLTAYVLPASAWAADWPQFRGAKRDNIVEASGLYRTWPEGGPKELWRVSMCQGYAAPAVLKGRVYLNDYDEKAKTWHVRCLNLSDGKENWRFSEKRVIRPSHGITRSAPAVDEQRVYSLDPKCVLHCLDIATGKELWRKSLVKTYKARIPAWYNGQCPLIEEDRLIIGVGGKEALLVALKKPTGEEIWRTPNKDGWLLSHASVMPAELCGVRQYLWCTLRGMMSVAADDGRLLWHHPYKFNTAVAPSPIAVDEDRVFMTSGYNAGSLMIRVKKEGERFSTEQLFCLEGSTWNSEVHTPIVYKGHMFAVGARKRGLFTCLDFDGNVVWDSKGKAAFGLGAFLLANDMFFVLEGKTGMLRLLEASTTEYKELAKAQVLEGHDVWAPMVIVDGKLLLRDMKKMLCVEVGPSSSGK